MSNWRYRAVAMWNYFPENDPDAWRRLMAVLGYPTTGLQELTINTDDMQMVMALQRLEPNVEMWEEILSALSRHGEIRLARDRAAEGGGE